MPLSPPPLPPPAPLADELAEVATDVARGAAAVLSEAYGQRRTSVETKSSPTDMVSEVDRAAESWITGELARRRPDDALLAEEGGERPGSSGVRWVVDPLDGTTNYLFGIPAWSVSVAAEWEGRAAVGVVVDPSRGEEWRAVRGRGATCNGEPCRIATGRSTLATALVATGFSYRRDRRQWAAQLLTKVLPEVRDIRRFGSAAVDLCWVAGGRFDAFYEWGLNPWDLAAGRLICEEAGATVSEDHGMVIVAGPQLYEDLRRLVAEGGGLAPPA